MTAFKGTPGPYWHDDGMIRAPTNAEGVQSGKVLAVVRDIGDETESNTELFASAPDLLEACQTFAEWLRREDAGLPAGIERGTPDGERKWREWWDENLRICDLAQKQAVAAIAKATGEQP